MPMSMIRLLTGPSPFSLVTFTVCPQELPSMSSFFLLLLASFGTAARYTMILLAISLPMATLDSFDIHNQVAFGLGHNCHFTTYYKLRVSKNFLVSPLPPILWIVFSSPAPTILRGIIHTSFPSIVLNCLWFLISS